eukprot:CAMPEP_0183738210 /NCGR_PEP_ID=MMETSP0737-20130205/54022_1 /TAXON_ID=385413 /ORGANISM="Thalassiosira miniscula, Strain CCMP1093" /LENGTH=68 /DNA_ID=CAMNT_0025972695 /DNA_START=20 /DNA_END=223 /DNA_ORIENTATION=+
MAFANASKREGHGSPDVAYAHEVFAMCCGLNASKSLFRMAVATIAKRRGLATRALAYAHTMMDMCWFS